jgi:phosphohistidine phosphatase
MKNLILIRHGKSNWEVTRKDFDRPLDKKGVQNSHMVSSSLTDFLPRTFIMWSSAARRTWETAVIFAQNISFPIESIIFKDELYTFDEGKLEKEIKKCDDSYDNLILFGHNEAITNFVNKFGDKFIENVPTSGVVSIKFDTDSWKSIEKGETVKKLFPKDLIIK